MAQTVKVLNWNIQNYGKTKSGFKDIVDGIAETVYAIRPDIFALVELNTTLNSTAGAVAASIAKALYALSLKNGVSEYRLCILSSNTGLEYYAFFIRDPTKTIPLHPIDKTVGGHVSTIGGLFYPSFADVEFRKFTYTFVAGKIKISEGACLLYPDVQKVSIFGRPLGLPTWPGTRQPALCMFWCPSASGANKLLPIIVCHFAPNSNLAIQQFQTLRYFSPINGVSPQPLFAGPPSVPLNISYKIGGATATANVRNYVLTGDFNVNFIDPTQRTGYSSVEGVAYPDLGGVPAIKDGTHLVTPKFFSQRDFKSTAQLPISGFDNFFLRSGPPAPAAVTFAGPLTTNIPELIRIRQIKLLDSVSHYAELDQRGFQAGDYKLPLTDYASQLLGRTAINLSGSLIGGRIISDHLPVSFTLTLP